MSLCNSGDGIGQRKTEGQIQLEKRKLGGVLQRMDTG